VTTGERVIAFIEAYCRVPEGALVGQPMKLAPFQKKFIIAVYDNPAHTRRAYLSIARKNAKTATIACLVLAHLVGPVAVPNSQIISGARSRDQASLVFHLAEKIVRMSSKLQKIVRIVPSSKRLVGLLRNVEYRAISAEGKTAHGLSPALAILDEVGQVVGSQDDFVDAITTSQGAHEKPLLIAISTQAPTDADLFSVWLDDAERSKDPRIVSHVYKAEEGADVLDERAWAAANPALGLFRSLDDLREQAIQASRMPSAENTFRNLCLNQRVSVLSSFVSRNIWLGCGEEPPPSLEGRKLYCGLDLSGRRDLTAFVAISFREGKWDVWCKFWAPEEGLVERSKQDRVPYDVWAKDGYLSLTPGNSVDYEYVAKELQELLAESEIAAWAFDRWRMDFLKKEMEDIGFQAPLYPFGQGYKDMSPAIDEIETELLNGRLRHGNNPVLTMCASNSVVKMDEAGNRKLDKAKATGRIDGMVALTMARGIVSKEEELEEKEYSMFFI
jgi:phage terminase large subunit-like protein